MLSKTAEKIASRKYYKQDEDFKRLCLRVAMAVAEREETSELYNKYIGDYFQLMHNLWFLPAGRILANAGEPNGNFYNCGVLPIADSRESIFDTLKTSAEIFAHGGGLGINFSAIREFGAPVSTGSRASGPVSFMDMFDKAASVMSQTSRRGGFLGVLNVDHPDIEKFIEVKNGNGDLPHFNISVGITDDFMQAVKNDEMWMTYSRYDGEPHTEYPARELFKEIASCAWNSGEPGVIFLDRLNEFNAVPHLGEIKSTNLCGEEPLLDYEMCDLGSINLVKMLTRDTDGTVGIDEAKLIYTVYKAVRFLDSVHDVTSHILPSIREASLRTRKIGLGVMGWADVLMLTETPYDSQRARDLARKIGNTIKSTAYAASTQLAKEWGAYPAFDPEKSRNIWYPDSPVTPTRNAQLLSLAPTGSISLLAGVNSGIEPYFALAYTKNVTEGEHDIKYRIKEAKAIDYLREYVIENVDCACGETVLKHKRKKILDYARKHKSLEGLGNPDIESVFKTAHEIDPLDHIKMQSAWQENVRGGAISKTINLPFEASKQDIQDAIMLGWKLGLKGQTFYRDNCRSQQIMER